MMLSWLHHQFFFLPTILYANCSDQKKSQMGTIQAHLAIFADHCHWCIKLSIVLPAAYKTFHLHLNSLQELFSMPKILKITFPSSSI